MEFSLSSISSLFSKPTQSVIGLDIGTSSIKLVQLRRERGRVVLETYGAIALGPYAGVEIGRATSLPAEKIGEALKDVIREANVTTSDAAISIPYASSLISLVKLPASVETQLASVMPIEARKYIPVPINEVLLDWFVVTGGKQVGADGKIEVLLVAIHNDTITKFRSMAADAKLAVSFFEIEVFSAVRAALDHGLAPVAVVDMGAATTKFYIVERGLIRESHIINHGAQDMTLAASRALGITVAQAEERKRKFGIVAMPENNIKQSLELSLTPLVAEIARTAQTWEQSHNQSLGALVLTGGGATLKGLKEFMQGKIQNELRLSDPFGKTQAPAFLEAILKEAGPEFSVAVGLALRRLQELG
ncbi:MAG TPA: type IV pilus assembly protein PilM [Candidatus Paceibacterota bacterium]|jgi:type IV pilus assembly protein PilM|nr:type IV pilus assembly protein PilM [Candidatus Paceibacterota bacterium]